MTQNLNCLTLNCQGLRAKEKRARLYTYVKKQKFGVAMLQETHFTSDINFSELDKFCYAFHSFGKSNSKGVSILISKRSHFQVINSKADNEGRYSMINGHIDENYYTFVNLYAPNDDKQRKYFLKDYR